MDNPSNQMTEPQDEHVIPVEILSEDEPQQNQITRSSTLPEQIKINPQKFRTDLNSDLGQNQRKHIEFGKKNQNLNAMEPDKQTNESPIFIDLDVESLQNDYAAIISKHFRQDVYILSKNLEAPIYTQTQTNLLTLFESYNNNNEILYIQLIHKIIQTANKSEAAKAAIDLQHKKEAEAAKDAIELQHKKETEAAKAAIELQHKNQNIIKAQIEIEKVQRQIDARMEQMKQLEACCENGDDFNI